MTRTDLQKILIKYDYSNQMVISVLCGRRIPSYEKMCKLKDEFGIPLEAWRDIKAYLQENDTKKTVEDTTAKGA